MKKKLNEKISKYSETLTVKKRKLTHTTGTWEDLKEKVERLTIKIRKLTEELERSRKEGSDCGDNKSEAEEELAMHESKLAELIASRERQPLGKMKKGLEVQYWDVTGKPKGRDLRKYYDEFDFENSENPADKFFIAPFLKMPNVQLFKTFWGKKNLLGSSFNPVEFLFKASGVFHAPRKDKYTFEVISDDGTFLYFGAHAQENEHAVIKNGGFHGMRKKTFTFPMEKDQEQLYVLTFWQHHHPAGVRFRMYDSKRRQIHGAFRHFDTSMQRV